MSKFPKKFRAKVGNISLARNGKNALGKPTLVLEVSAEMAGGREVSEKAPPGFDVWTATEKQFISLIEAGKISINGPVASQWAGAMFINRDREQIEASGPSLMKALSVIAKQGLVMPDWMAKCYLERYGKIERFELASFDEAFGPLPYKRGKKFARLNEYRRLMPLVSRELVKAIRADPSRPIDNNLFDEVGAIFSLGHTKIEEVYREGVRDHGCQNLVELKAVLQYKP